LANEKCDCDDVQQRFCSLRHDALEQAHALKFEKLDLKLQHMDGALVLRTIDLERRLEELNKLRQDVVTDRDIFMKKEVYDKKIDGYDSWIVDVNEKITKLMVAYDARITIAKLTGVSGIVLGVAGIIISIVLHVTGAR
jgi:hypothetical protein